MSAVEKLTEQNSSTGPETGTREWLQQAVAGRHPSVGQVLRHFSFAHLTGKLRVVSSHCCDLALSMVFTLKDDPELVVGLRHLLEAKDAFVRTAVEG